MIVEKHEIELEKLLLGSVFQQENNIDSDIWDAGFNVDRQLICSKLGLYEKVFLRPEKYTKRFYHKIYPLVVEDWQIVEQAPLYEGFCMMNITLDMRFQATLKYAENNLDILPKINEHIKSAYENELLSLIHSELKTLSDGSWIENGLNEIEKKISVLAAEMLVLHNIQAHVLCSLKPHFEEFPNVQIAKENVYLRILKKDFESGDQTQQELFRQELEAEKRNQQQKQSQLQQLDRDLEIERRKMALDAESKRLILVEKEGQQIEHFAIEKRLHADKIEHENRLKEIHLEAELREQKKQHQKQRELEQEEQIIALTHKQQLEEKQLYADVLKYELQQKLWSKAKEQARAQKWTLKQDRKERIKNEKAKQIEDSQIEVKE